MKIDTLKPNYYFLQNKRKVKVAPQLNRLAAKIDADGDGIISDRELSDYLSRDEVQVLKTTPRNAECKCSIPYYQTNPEQVVKEYKAHLEGKVFVPESYHSFEDIEQHLSELAEKYPDKAKLVSLGKTHEGRNIWALKIGTGKASTVKRPALVFTGAHHAREWVTPEIPLNLADQLLTKYDSDPAMKNRVDNSQIWIIPVANPDGFVYSRTVNSMWRKNRRPIQQTACDLLNHPKELKAAIADAKIRRAGEIKGIGVDLNRNYYDGNPEHFYLYRPEGDDPCSIFDDMPSTSDDPNQLTYRGPEGGSEAEVKALTKLTLRPSVKGIINYHSYGNMILYPWGFTREPVENQNEYIDLGREMQAGMDDQFTLIDSCGLYPATGDPQDMQQINGKMSYTLEMGSSFQPSNKTQIKRSIKDGTSAALTFIDHFLKKS